MKKWPWKPQGSPWLDCSLDRIFEDVKSKSSGVKLLDNLKCQNLGTIKHKQVGAVQNSTSQALTSDSPLNSTHNTNRSSTLQAFGPMSCVTNMGPFLCVFLLEAISSVKLKATMSAHLTHVLLGLSYPFHL